MSGPKDEARRLLKLKSWTLVRMRCPRGHLIGSVFETPRGAVWEALDALHDRAGRRGADVFPADYDTDQLMVQRVDKDGRGIGFVQLADPNSPWPLEIPPPPKPDDLCVGACTQDGWFSRSAIEMIAAAVEARSARKTVQIFGERYSTGIEAQWASEPAERCANLKPDS